MTGAMRCVGAVIRLKYLWVSINIPLYLVLDNAGGYGTNEYIADYVTTLKMIIILSVYTKLLGHIS